MKQIQSKFFALIAAILIATVMLAGCASASPEVSTQVPPPPTEVPPAPPTKVPTQPPPTQTMSHEHTPTATESASKIDPVAFHQIMRDLWVDHTFWTRNYIVSAVAELPDAELTAGRLLQNQVNIGNAVAGFYGEEAGVALTELLHGHILTAAELIAAAKSGNQDAVTAASEAWYTNADQISAFLSGANPAWPEDAVKDMMYMHLDQTLSEATAQLTGDYATSIAEYDHIVTHIQTMADVLSTGIITQFSDKFK